LAQPASPPAAILTPRKASSFASSEQRVHIDLEKRRRIRPNFTDSSPNTSDLYRWWSRVGNSNIPNIDGYRQQPSSIQRLFPVLSLAMRLLLADTITA